MFLGCTEVCGLLGVDSLPGCLLELGDWEQQTMVMLPRESSG